MQAGVSLARQPRSQHRHQIRTLTYVMLDPRNGGMVRDLTQAGIGVKAVAGVHARQQVYLRLELRSPRLRVETRGEVVWADPSGQCGIRFLDRSPQRTRRINEWIFSNLLEAAAPHAGRARSLFSERSPSEPAPVESPLDLSCGASSRAEEDDGLIVSATPLKVIQLPAPQAPPEPAQAHDELPESAAPEPANLDWLSQPLSGRSLAWTVNALVVVAALLLFTLVFLSITREAPKWPVAMTLGAAAFVASLYWGFSRFLGGATLGARLARLAGSESEEEVEARFR